MYAYLKATRAPYRQPSIECAGLLGVIILDASRSSRLVSLMLFRSVHIFAFVAASFFVCYATVRQYASFGSQHHCIVAFASCFFHSQENWNFNPVLFLPLDCRLIRLVHRYTQCPALNIHTADANALNYVQNTINFRFWMLFGVFPSATF